MLLSTLIRGYHKSPRVQIILLPLMVVPNRSPLRGLCPIYSSVILIH